MTKKLFSYLLKSRFSGVLINKVSKGEMDNFETKHTKNSVSILLQDSFINISLTHLKVFGLFIFLFYNTVVVLNQH